MHLQKIKEFNKTFGHLVSDAPTIPSDWKLRKLLIEEETKEVFEAIEEGDKVNLLKELSDLQYVLSGLILACGFEDVIDDAITEVHRSNMSKFFTDKRRAEMQLDIFVKSSNEFFEVRELTGGRFGIYNESGKLIKPIGYYKADMEQFFEGKKVGV